MNIGEKFYCSKCMREIESEEICPYCGYDHSKENGPKMLEEGTLLHGGRYQIGAVIGSGGFGITYAAWDLVLNRPAAIKEYFPEDLCSRDAEKDYLVHPDAKYKDLYMIGLTRFTREARILATLRDVKNVVPVLEWFEDNDTAYIVMDYIRGMTLDEYVRKNAVDPQNLIRILRDLVDSLILVHEQGILHRDISPSNIMIREDDTPVLIDFGAASSEERRAEGKDRTAIYNRSFSPAEQRDEAGVQGPWTDVYALSATLYAMICGEPPADPSVRNGSSDPLRSPGERGIRLKKYQERAIMQGLAVLPEKRIRSMEVFRSILYDLPMPEEVLCRRRFMARVITAAALITIFAVLAAVNFTYGFFLGKGIRYSLNADGWHVSGSSGISEELIIPEKILGISVSQINENAFQGSDVLRDVSIPGTVDTVGAFAFSNCENLVSVTILEGVRKLSPQAFSACPALQAVFIPDTLAEFSKETFANSESHLVLLGNSGTQSAETAKEADLHFAHIETEENDTGITLLKYETEQSKALVPDAVGGRPVTEIGSGVPKVPVFPANVQEIILPKQLEKIGDYAFQAAQIIDIKLPDTVKSIGYMAFSQSHLESIHLPESVIFVDRGAFQACVVLKSAVLSPNMEKIPASCFEKARRLESVTIPEGITIIEELAFNKCDGLTSLSLPESLKRIDDRAFMECASLQTLYLPPALDKMNIKALDSCPNSLTIIGYENSLAHYLSAANGLAFYSMNEENPKTDISKSGGLFIREGISEEKRIKLPSYNRAVAADRIYDAKLLKSEDVILPDRLQSIAASAFYGNQYLKSVAAPDTLEVVDTFAFANCSNLQRAVLQEGLTKISSAAFLSCSSLEQIDLPATVSVIQQGAFENCEKLTSVNIPASLTFLDDDVFANTGLTEVTIPGNISKCRTSFYGCQNLKKATLNEGVRTLWGTFAECDALETVIIPASMRQISRSAFMNCSSLKDVWIYSDNVSLDFMWTGLQHIDYYGLENGKVNFSSLVLESENNTPLFMDSPDLTIHAHRGSSAHLYAIRKNIKFEAIPDDGNRQGSSPETDIMFTASEQIYSDAEMIAALTPQEGNTADYYWSQFRYCLGYGFTDLAYKCLDYIDRSDDEYYRILSHSARSFLDQADAHGYSIGLPVAYFEDHQPNPTMRAGDIITAVDGTPLLNADDYDSLKKRNPSGPWVFTLLRENEDGILETVEVSAAEEDPFPVFVPIAPLTFETAR